MAKKKANKKKYLNKKDLANIERLNLKQLLKFSGTERLRIKGKFISREVESDLIEFAAVKNVPVQDYIKKNEKDITFYLKNKSVTKSYRTDDLISLVKSYKGKLVIEGYDIEGSKPKLYRKLQALKKKLINRKDVNIADLYHVVKINTGTKKLTIDLSDAIAATKASEDEIEDFESDSFIMIFSNKK